MTCRHSWYPVYAFPKAKNAPAIGRACWGCLCFVPDEGSAAMTNDELVENLAHFEHESWARWMRWMFEVGTIGPDGSLIIPLDLAHRWMGQAKAMYADLSEQEKESDRKEVRRILPVIEDYCSRREGL